MSDICAPSDGCRPYVTAAAVSAVRVEFLENWTDVAAIEREWNALLRESSADSIFLTWEWVRCWADVVGPGIRPFVVTARNSRGDLVGVVPFYRATYRLRGVVPYRVLRVMADYPTGSDYPDWIVRRDCDEAVTTAIVKALDSGRGWDCIWMPSMAGWTGSFERIVAACRARGLRCQIRPCDFAFFELPSDKEAYFRSLSKNKRQQLRAELKRLKLSTVDISRCDTDDQVPGFLEALFDLHERRWGEKGDAGTFKRKPSEAVFYRRFVPVALRKGWLRFYGLRDGGEFKAIQIGYVYRGVYHQLQEGFDPEYQKGAGNVLRAKVIEACIDEGINAYDFLGEMTEHKRRWQAQARAGHDLFISRPTAKNLLLSKGGVWPTGRFLRQVSPPGHGAPRAD
jgi:CelD/BcsL family acetyltransferase involved in cellulose biosynthesis